MLNVKTLLVLVMVGMGVFALSTETIDTDNIGFQPEPELRHILKNK